MAYEKHKWNNELITDELLNHMEDGIANANISANVNYYKVATLSVVSSPIAVRFNDDGSLITHNTIAFDYNTPDGHGRLTLAEGTIEFSAGASIWLDTDPRALTPIITNAGFPDITDTTKWWIGQMLQNYNERIATAGAFRVTWNLSE